MKKKTALAWILANTVIWSVQALANTENSNCVNIIKTHGFLSRAQFQCGFKYYSNEMMQEAKACSQTLPEKESMELLKFGMQSFDRNEMERGHIQLCEDILHSFPNILRK